MNMNTSLGFLIRDGLESDIDACLALDHSYITDYVWQMHTDENGDESRQISFKTQRLPRSLESVYEVDERRLRLTLPAEHSFVVAVEKTSGDLLGYLTMRNDPAYQIGWLQDVVVSAPYRHGRIGSRLVNIARIWAKEHGLIQVTAEVHTRNYPAIAFCQQVGFKFCGFNDRYFPNHDIAVFFTQPVR